MRRQPARRSSSSLKGLLANPSRASGASSASSSAAARRPLHAVRLPAGEVLRPGEVVEVEDQRQPALGQVVRHGRGRRELVDGHVARRRVLGVHPVLERLAGQIVVDGLGEDLRAPARRRAGRRAACRVCVPVASCGLRVGMNWCTATGLPAAALTAPQASYGEVMAARTATTRKSVAARTGLRDGLVPALLQQAGTRLRAAAGVRPPGRPRAARRRTPRPAGSPSGRPASRPGASRLPTAASNWPRSAAAPYRRPCRSARRHPEPAAATDRRCSPTGSPRRSRVPRSATSTARWRGSTP